MPVTSRRSPLASQIAAVPRRHDNDYPLWQGPCAKGPLGGVTQSMLVRFLSCRERFRLRYVLGLELPDKWNKNIGYGNMWHVCEEAHAAGRSWEGALTEYTRLQYERYRLQHEEVMKWHCVCCVQFPEYVRYWSHHPDVLGRTPLMQEQVFDVPYHLPSGRTVRLRGKFDSVDLIDGGVWLQENKTKGDIDRIQVERQLKFDLQTCLYLIALWEHPSCDLPREGYYRWGAGRGVPVGEYSIRGVRYNVVRRPLSGGKGNITQHKQKSTKNTYTPAESAADFYERLRRDYIADDPGYWFFRVRTEVSAQDIQVFRDTCLDPLLDTVCWWYDCVTGYDDEGYNDKYLTMPLMNYRTPFGVWSALEEGGSTEYDSYLESGSEAGLRRIETLFTELQ